jgi:hypothetical protein
VPNLVSFSTAEFLTQNRENRGRRALSLYRVKARYVVCDMGQKILFVAIMFRLVSRVPALVIESAHQHWHLGSQVNGVIGWQAVANRMQN